MPGQTPVTKVFFCYAPEDEALCVELERHLALLQREGAVRGWSSRAIGAGKDWRAELGARMDGADVILLLVSADFLASDPLDEELRRARRRGTSDIVGVLLRPCDWKQGQLRDLIMLPRPEGKPDPLPVTSWASTDEAFAEVARWLRARFGSARSDRSGFGIEGRITRNPFGGSPPVSAARVSQAEAQKLPSVWNIPVARNRYFTGRADELDRMQQLLASTAPGTDILALHGLGGSGKTQLALEYAYRRAADYDVVWWLPAEEPATLAAAFADLAVALRLPGRNEPEQRVAVEAVRQWLGKSGRWLLVFDSVREPSDLTPYLLAGRRGHILITSRHAAWRPVAWDVPIKGLRRGDSVEFLLARSGARERSNESQERRAADLAAELGDLPLALEQAAAYIDESGTTIGAYLSLFQERQAELLRVGAAGQTVVATWDIAFREVTARSPAAGELLDLCAFLAPDDIPRDALRAGAAGFPPALAAAARDPMALNEVVRVLRSYSLVEGQEDALGVHRLVQATVRGRLPDAERRAWAERALALVSRSFPDHPDEPAQRDACRRWLPHASAVLEHARAAELYPDEPEESLLRVGAHYLHLCGFDGKARAMFERALELAEKVHGPKHTHVSMALTDLGVVLMELKDLTGARRYAERALAIDEALFGGADPRIATDSINLASVLLDLGDLGGARRHAERALAIDEALSEPEGAAVARDENHLGTILWRQGELESALRHAERAVALDERHRAPNDPDLARDLNNLGFMLREMRDLKGARERLRRALDIGEAAFGPDDPQVATYHSNLASVLQELREFDAARAHFERAVEIGEAIYGPEHHAVAIRRNNLGVLLLDMGDLVGARAEMARAVEIATRALGPDHRRVKKLEGNLAEIERRMARAGQG